MDRDRVLLNGRCWPASSEIGCVLLPILPIRVEVLRHPEWDGAPLVLGPAPGERRVVQLCSPEAEAAGITPGLPLREVLSLCSDAITVQPDPVQLAAVVNTVLEGLQQVSPVVEYRPHGFFLSLRGLATLYEHDLDRLEQAIRRAVPPLLLPRIGIGNSTFVAALAADAAPATAGMKVVPAEESAVFLSGFPVRYLPLTPPQQARLESLGLRTIGQVARLPFAAVQAQFGPQGALAWRLAQGQEVAPIVPQRRQETIRAAIRFDDPIASVEAFYAALKALLIRAFTDGRLAGRAVRRICLNAVLSNGASWRETFAFKNAITGRDAVYQALKDKLQLVNAAPPAPIEELSIELLDLGAEAGKQATLFTGNTRRERQIAEATRQLRARYGYVPLYRVVEVEPWSRIPEHRWALMPCEL